MWYDFVANTLSELLIWILAIEVVWSYDCCISEFFHGVWTLERHIFAFWSQLYVRLRFTWALNPSNITLVLVNLWTINMRIWNRTVLSIHGDIPSICFCFLLGLFTLYLWWLRIHYLFIHSVVIYWSALGTWIYVGKSIIALLLRGGSIHLITSWWCSHLITSRWCSHLIALISTIYRLFLSLILFIRIIQVLILSETANSV